MREFIQKIESGGITPLILKEMIQKHKKDRDHMLSLYKRYTASVEGVPILQRAPVEYEDFETGSIKRIDNKVNNRLNNSFDAEIVDTKVGYLFGHAISYEADKSLTALISEMEEFNIRNNIADKDSEWGKKAAICGYGARVAYIDKTGKERIQNVDPWEVIILSKEDITEPLYAVRYYQISEDDYRAEFYDDVHVYEFTSKNGEDYNQIKITPHTFDFCPLYGLPNNEELMADAERVLSLIDAYNRTLSDASNEIEQYRLAYLILKGVGADEETLDKLKKTGILELFDEKDSVDYLTKDIDGSLIEQHLDRLEDNILRLSKSANFSDEQFGGNITGVAMKFKIMALENKCITMERKMTAALRYQYKVLCSSWEKRGKCKQDDYLKVWFGFKRNLPANYLDEAQTTAQLKGHVSERTRLSLLSFVDDVDWELEEMKKEQQEQMEMFGTPLGSVTDNPPVVENEDGNNQKSKRDTCPTCGGTGRVISEVTQKDITCPKCKGDGVIS